MRYRGRDDDLVYIFAEAHRCAARAEQDHFRIRSRGKAGAPMQMLGSQVFHLDDADRRIGLEPDEGPSLVVETPSSNDIERVCVLRSRCPVKQGAILRRERPY